MNNLKYIPVFGFHPRYHNYSPKKRKELQRFLQRKLNISRVISLKAPETTTGSAVVTATVYCNGVDIAEIIKGQDNNK